MTAAGAGTVRRTSSSGMILVSSLLLLTLLGLAVGASLYLTRSELWAAGSARAARQARYSAEAGLRHAVALLAPGTDFTALLRRTGGLARADDPGPLPLAGGGWVDFPGPPFGYWIEIENDREGGDPLVDGNERVVFAARATSVRDAARKVIGTIGRAVQPYAPAALVTLDGALILDPGLEGATVRIDAGNESDRRPATIGASSDAAALAVFAAAHARDVELAGTPATAVALPFDVAALADRAGAAPQPADGLASDLGSRASPAVAVVEPGVAPGLRGAGALVATGDLEIRGVIDFAGVIIVAGVLRLAATSCTVEGMVWASRLVLDRSCLIRFTSLALGLADRAIRLPREAELLALEDGS
jgi:hypothetical protein